MSALSEEILSAAETRCKNLHPARWTTLIERRTTCLACKEATIRDLRPDPPPPDAATIAAVLAEHWDYGPTKDYDGWECGCGERISGSDVEGVLDDAMQAHVAAQLLAAEPIAQALAAVARVEALAESHFLVSRFDIRAALRPGSTQ